MLYVSEKYKNVFGQYQYKTLYKSEDFNEANKAFREYAGDNEVTIDSSIDGETLAIKKAITREV